MELGTRKEHDDLSILIVHFISCHAMWNWMGNEMFKQQYPQQFILRCHYRLLLSSSLLCSLPILRTNGDVQRPEYWIGMRRWRGKSWNDNIRRFSPNIFYWMTDEKTWMKMRRLRASLVCFRNCIWVANKRGVLTNGDAVCVCVCRGLDWEKSTESE